MSNKNNYNNSGKTTNRDSALKRKRYFKNLQFLNSFNVPLTNQFNLLNEEEEADITERPAPVPKV